MIISILHIDIVMYISSLFSFFSFLSFFGEKIQRGTKAAHNEHYNYRYICLISKDSALDFFFGMLFPLKIMKKSLLLYMKIISLSKVFLLWISLLFPSLSRFVFDDYKTAFSSYKISLIFDRRRSNSNENNSRYHLAI